MASCSDTTTLELLNVGIGQIAVAQQPAVLRCVLGSCVSVVLYHPRKHVGALAHVVLPASSGRTDHPGRFADTAIAEAIRLLKEQDAKAGGLIARIAGGASMFGSDGPLQIGHANIEAVEKALGKANISIKARHVGGTKGRRVSLNCANGNMTVEVVGANPVNL